MNACVDTSIEFKGSQGHSSHRVRLCKLFSPCGFENYLDKWHSHLYTKLLMINIDNSSDYLKQKYSSVKWATGRFSISGSLAKACGWFTSQVRPLGSQTVQPCAWETTALRQEVLLKRKAKMKTCTPFTVVVLALTLGSGCARMVSVICL